jgi:hypothetical protein
MVRSANVLTEVRRAGRTVRAREERVGREGRSTCYHRRPAMLRGAYLDVQIRPALLRSLRLLQT